MTKRKTSESALDNATGYLAMLAMADLSVLQKGEHMFSRLEAKLLPSLIPTTEFAKAIGKSITELQNLAPSTKPEALVAVLWMLRLRHDACDAKHAGGCQ